MISLLNAPWWLGLLRVIQRRRKQWCQWCHGTTIFWEIYYRTCQKMLPLKMHPSAMAPPVLKTLGRHCNSIKNWKRSYTSINSYPHFNFIFMIRLRSYGISEWNKSEKRLIKGNFLNKTLLKIKSLMKVKMKIWNFCSKNLVKAHVVVSENIKYNQKLLCYFLLWCF